MVTMRFLYVNRMLCVISRRNGRLISFFFNMEWNEGCDKSYVKERNLYLRNDWLRKILPWNWTKEGDGLLIPRWHVNNMVLLVHVVSDLIQFSFFLIWIGLKGGRRVMSSSFEQWLNKTNLAMNSRGRWRFSSTIHGYIMGTVRTSNVVDGECCARF